MSYAWGSVAALAELAGRDNPSGEPEAELWMGAHEAAPSQLMFGGSSIGLDRWIEEWPSTALGEDVAARFGGRLPFLLKVLAPERVLSIQCHPSAQQVAQAPAETYLDAWPKPEALLTVTDFEAFIGLHELDGVRFAVSQLQVDALSRLVCTSSSVDEILERMLTLPPAEQVDLSASVAFAANRIDASPRFAAISRAASDFPGDVGVAVLALMRFHQLPPNRFVFVPNGLLHAYARGVAVEVLANSDNVVRAGLTSKPLDIAELQRIVDTGVDVAVQQPAAGARLHSFRADTEFFGLTQIFPGSEPIEVPPAGPRIVLSLHGDTTVVAGAESVELSPLQSCFVPAAVGRVEVFGTGTAFVASVGYADVEGV